MGYKDARLEPDSKMSPEETIDWTPQLMAKNRNNSATSYFTSCTFFF
jgi:hypothetical protein